MSRSRPTLADALPAQAGLILEALERHGNDRLATAKALGIHKSTLHRKVHALGLVLPHGDGRSRKRFPLAIQASDRRG